MDEVRRHILEAPGVPEVHDLHAWTITSCMNVVSARVALDADGAPGDVFDHLGRCLSADFDINHFTFSSRHPSTSAGKLRRHSPSTSSHCKNLAREKGDRQRSHADR